MRARWLLVSICLLGCRSTPVPRTCDPTQLAELGVLMPDMPGDERGDSAWAGIQAACGLSLPPSLIGQFESSRPVDEGRAIQPDPGDAQLAAMIARACPSWEQVVPEIADAPAELRGGLAYDRCNFARYGVIDHREAASRSSAIAAWAVHQWLLDQGFAPERVRLLTRGLLQLEQDLALGLNDGQRGLPCAPADPIRDGVAVRITRDWLALEGRPLLDETLYDALVATVEQANRTLLIAAHDNTSSHTIDEVLTIAESAGYTRFGFVVSMPEFGLGQFPIEVAEFESGTDEPAAGDEPQMTIEIPWGHLSLSTQASHHVDPVTVRYTEVAAIQSYAAAVVRTNPGTRRVVILVAPPYLFHQLFDVIEAARSSLPDVIVRLHHPEESNTPEGVMALGNAGLVSRVPYKPAVQSAVRQLPATVHGSIDPEYVRRVVRAHLTEIMRCHMRELVDDPTLAGNLTIEFVIGTTGKVESAVVSAGSLAGTRTATCVASAFARWTFAEPGDGKPIEVSYPLELEPDGYAESTFRRGQ